MPEAWLEEGEDGKIKANITNVSRVRHLGLQQIHFLTARGGLRT